MMKILNEKQITNEFGVRRLQYKNKYKYIRSYIREKIHWIITTRIHSNKVVIVCFYSFFYCLLFLSPFLYVCLGLYPNFTYFQFFCTLRPLPRFDLVLFWRKHSDPYKWLCQSIMYIQQKRAECSFGV